MSQPQDGSDDGTQTSIPDSYRNSSGRPSVGGLTIKVSVPAKDQTETSTASKTHTASEADGARRLPPDSFDGGANRTTTKRRRNSVASSGHGSDDEAPKSPVIRPSRSRPRSRSLRGGVGFSTSKGTPAATTRSSTGDETAVNRRSRDLAWKDKFVTGGSYEPPHWPGGLLTKDGPKGAK